MATVYLNKNNIAGKLKCSSQFFICVTKYLKDSIYKPLLSEISVPNQLVLLLWICAETVRDNRSAPVEHPSHAVVRRMQEEKEKGSERRGMGRLQ